jgi:hypothetical protein
VSLIFLAHQPTDHRYTKSVFRAISKICDLEELAIENTFPSLFITPYFNPDFGIDDTSKLNAMNMLPLLTMKRVVLVGVAAAECFGISRDQYDFASWFDYHLGENIAMAVLPYPMRSSIYYSNREFVGMVESLIVPSWEEEKNRGE